MPSLRTLGDAEELDNLYIDKCVIYVEGEHDQKIWERVVGPDVADRIEFKVPQISGSGYELVCRRVASERPKNEKIFGLIDGEVASAYAQVESLILCSDPIFVLNDAALDGILFIAEHEVENLLLRFSGVSSFILNDVRIAGAGTRDINVIEKELGDLARRFFVAALCKYASAHLRARGSTAGILNVDRFRSRTESTRDIVKSIKTRLAEEGPAHVTDLMREIRSIMKVFRAHVRGQTFEFRQTQILRLAEGKGLLIAVRQRWGMSANSEGHLLDHVSRSPYASEFRDSLLDLTVNRFH